MLVYAARYQLRYRRFINDFFRQFGRIQQNVPAYDLAGQGCTITTDQASRLAPPITTAGEISSPMATNANLVFGDGALLTMWQVDIPEKMRPTLLALLSAMPMLTGEFINMIPTNCCLGNRCNFSFNHGEWNYMIAIVDYGVGEPVQLVVQRAEPGG